MPQPFISPLAEITTVLDEDGKPMETINSWGAASMIANIACDREAGNKDSCLSMLQDLVPKANPLLDLNALIERGKTSDEAIATLIQAAADGLEDKMAEAFGEQR